MTIAALSEYAHVLTHMRRARDTEAKHLREVRAACMAEPKLGAACFRTYFNVYRSNNPLYRHPKPTVAYFRRQALEVGRRAFAKMPWEVDRGWNNPYSTE